MNGELARESLSIGRRLRLKRREKGLSQKAIADKVGVRRQTIADLENGKNVGSYLLYAVVQELNLSFTLEANDILKSEKKELSNQVSEPIQDITMDFDFPYDWSNTGNMPEKVLISKVLRGQRFLDIVRLCKRYGLDKIEDQVNSHLYDDIRPKLNSVLGNIRLAVGA